MANISPKTIRSELTALRKLYGKESLIGTRCTLLIEQFKVLPRAESENHRLAIEANIRAAYSDLQRFIAAARQGE